LTFLNSACDCTQQDFDCWRMKAMLCLLQKLRERKGVVKKQLRRSQSPATSDGDVSSSPSVGSDDDENAVLPKASLSVWIAEGEIVIK